MPELPEVETIKRGLQKTIVGKKIAGVQVLDKKSFKGELKEIVGKIIKSVDRRAKLLVIELGNKNNKTIKPFNHLAIYLLVHLKMTGQLTYLKSQNSNVKSTSQISKLKGSKKSPYDIDGLPNKFTRVIISFDDSSKLFFNDLRKFGWIKVIKLKIKNEKLKIDEIIGEKLGPEPFSKKFTVEYLQKILTKWGRPVKLILMDQKKIAGVGNIYANEALFCAGIAPHHRGRGLVKDHPEKIRRLYDCIRKVLEKGLRYEGSSAADEAYRKVNGTKGEMQEHFQVYQEEGQDCPNKCGQKIRRMTLGGRGTFFCPKCQR